MNRRIHVTQIPPRAQAIIEEAATLLGTTKHKDSTQSSAVATLLMVGARIFIAIEKVQDRRRFLEKWYPEKRHRRGRPPKKVG